MNPATPTDIPGFPKERQNFEWNLGRLVMNFGALEHYILYGIAELAKDDPAESPTKPLPEAFSKRVSLLERLATKRVENAETKKHRKELMGKIRKLGYTRNHLAHGAWLDRPHIDIDQVKGKIKRPHPNDITVKNLLEQKPGVEDVSWMRIAVLAAYVVDVLNELRAYLDKVKAAAMR